MTNALEDVSNKCHDVVLWSTLDFFFLHFCNDAIPLLRRNIGGADLALMLAHARVDVNVHSSPEERTILWTVDPAIDLPDGVQEDEQRPGEVQLEEVFGIWRAANWPQCDVELSNKSDDVDEHAQVRAPDTESGLVGDLIQGVTLSLPVEL